MDTESLPGTVARNQFAPFMRLLVGYRGRTSRTISKDELLQTWKSVTRYRDWISSISETTGLDKHDCLIAVSIIHFLAATNKKLMDRHAVGQREIPLAFTFLPRLIECLPAFSILLVQYIVKWTLNDAQERNTPYDRLKYTNTPNWDYAAIQTTQFDRPAKLFLLNCVLGSTCALLDTYRPMYNNMADESFYDKIVARASSMTAWTNRILTDPSTGGTGNASLKPLMGSFALHVRLVELCEEGDLLDCTEPKIDSALNLEERLTFEYHRMQAIDEQIDERFNKIESTSQKIRGLNLEDIGRSLKAAFMDLETTKTESVIPEIGDKHFDRYRLNRWGI